MAKMRNVHVDIIRKCKKPMHFENCSAFGGSSTSGTLTSTDSNHSNKDVASGTLTSTDSNHSITKPRSTSVQSAHLDVFGLTSSRALELPTFPEKQQSPSRSTSGSDLRQITVLERLTKTHPIWFLPTVGRSGAVHLLKDKDTGIFIVRKSSREDIMALSVQYPSPDGTQNVDHYLIEPTDQGLHLQGSSKLFSAIPNLIAHYCDNKEDLPHQLVLPPSIMAAKTSQELTALAMLGQDFWTSTRYEGQSRSSSRSNLSDQSALLNKSASEPISINKTPPVSAYSQSDTMLQNTPPKHSVIDFSSYLINKPKEAAEMSRTECARTLTSITESVHSKCSISESHVTGHMITLNHVTNSDMSLQDLESSNKRMVLHDCEKNETKRDSRVSVPYAKPKKGESRANSYCSTPLELLNIPEDYYFTSNLSDKLSDYEDIWKNNYADPKVGSVQADIVQRLQPNLLNHNNNNNSVSMEMNSKSVWEESKLYKEECFSGKCVVKDMDVSVEQVLASCDHSEVKTVQSHAETDMVINHTEFTETFVTSVECEPVIPGGELQEATHDVAGSVCTPTNCDSDIKTDDPAVVSCCFETINEQESDIDSCHSDSCLSDADADTEEGEVVPKIVSVQTQTSPSWKLKSPTVCSVARKSVSTSSLSTLRSPIYSEPFDAINHPSNRTEKAPKLPKKMRRRSAPALSHSRRKMAASGAHKTSPLVLAEEASNARANILKEQETGQCEVSVKEECVFEMSLEQITTNTQTIQEEVHQYEKAWVDKKTKSKPCDVAKVKPKPSPRKNKVVTKVEEGNRKTYHEFANRIERLKQQQTEEHDNKVCRKSNEEVMQELFDGFDINHNPSSPTISKFPVFQTQISNDSNLPCSESTAEDIITSFNPELTLRPLKPYPLLQLGPMSEYDNLNTDSYMATSGLSVASAGTVFCKPWENSVLGKIMNTTPNAVLPHHPVRGPAPGHAPPPLPPPQDMHERIKAWQESSQKYQTYLVQMEEENQFSLSDGTSIGAVTFGGEKSSTYDFQISSHCQSQAVKIGGQEKGFTVSGGTPDKTSSIPIYGADFRDKVAPILANPRLLKKTDRSRNPDNKIREYIISLSQDRATTFGSTIENFIQCTLDSPDTNPFNITRNVRQFMNGIKNYLVKHGEGELEDMIERERSQLGKDEILNIDAILEGSLHECVIQPLKQNIYRLFVNEYTRNGNLKVLSSNIKYARTKTAEEIGIRKGLSPPDGSTLELIKHYFTRMQKSYSPLKKLENLLGATSTIYKCVTSKHQGNSSLPSFGADDFLPMLIYVLVQCGMVSVEIEADYMWGLLHPSLLTGEGGYYLTSLSSAVLVLKNFRATQETSATHQEGKLPSISDMQGFLKIAIPDEQRDTIIWRTLPVRPSMTTRDVCSMIAHKFKITNPQDYGLYTLENGEECKLMDMECPQMLKVDRLAHKKDCIFAYKRNAANIAWPKSVK